MMRPEQIRDVVKRQVPVVLVSGSVEYHGPQEPIGTDFLIPWAVIERVEKECECIVMPPLPFSPTRRWAGGPADGQFDFDSKALGVYVKELLKGILAVGFRRIYILQHHQGREALPCVTLTKAVNDVMYEIAGKHYHGWGRAGDTPMDNFFHDVIQIAHIDTFSHYEPGQERCPVGHGGKGETQLIWGQYPETIDLSRLDYFKEHGLFFPAWLNDAHLATQEEGDFWLDFCAKGWIGEFKRPYQVRHKTLGENERPRVEE